MLRLTPEEATLQVSRRSLALGVTNAYQPDGIRWMVIELVLENRGDVPITVPTKAARLLVGQEELLRVQVNEELRNIPLFIEDGTINGHSQTYPEKLHDKGPVTVPANGGTVRTWLVFAQLPRTRDLPPMTVRIETSAGQVDLELSKREIESVTSELERIGPAGAIGIMRVKGEINAINAPVVQNMIGEIAKQGVSRLVMSFGPDSRVGDQLTAEWLLEDYDPDNDRLQFHPVRSGLFTNVVYVNFPGRGDETDDNLVMNDADAVQLVTHDLLPNLATNTLVREMQSGHPYIQRAILLNAGEVIANSYPDLILKVLDPANASAVDPATRKAAIRALRAAVDPRSISVLEEIARTGTRQDGILALNAMNQSIQYAAQQRVVELATDKTVRANIGLAMLIRSIDMRGDERWLPFLRAAFLDADPVVREATLTPLLSMEFTNRLDILKSALEDRHERIRDLAFAAMARNRHPEEQAYFESATIERLRVGKLDASTLTAARELRNPEVLSLLLKSLDAPPPDTSHALVTTTITVGGIEGVRAVMAKFDALDEESRKAVVRAVVSSVLPERDAFLIKGVSDPSQEVRELCLLAISQIGDRTALESLVNAIEKALNSDPSQGAEIARWIGLIGTFDARETLTSLKQKGTPQHQQFADAGLQTMNATSSVSNWVQAANQKTRENDLEGAITLLQLATEIDANSPIVYNSLGFSQLRLSRVDEAKKNFEKALQLAPTDHNPLTGVAICLAIEGKCDEAIAMVDTPLLVIKYGNQQIFLYNVACVYGRCLEHRLNDPQSAARDRVIHEYERRAMKFLNASVEQGFADISLLQVDPDLNPLRQLPEFGKLEQRIRDAN